MHKPDQLLLNFRMRPITLEECWICHKEYADKKLLKSHMASKSTHGGRLSVVCLWCHTYEKRFSRVNDLRHHVEEKHLETSKSLDRNLLTEQAAYWYSIFPADYRKLVTRVSPKGSSLAVEARRLVKEWLEKCSTIKRQRHQWMEDWANHPREMDEEATNSQSMDHSSEASAESANEDWLSCVPNIQLEEPGYDPLDPTMMTLYAVNLSSTITATFFIKAKDTTWYNVEIDPIIKEMDRYTAALNRRSKTIKPTGAATMSKTGKPIYGEEFYTKQKKCAEILAIPPAFITHIVRKEDLFSTSPRPSPFNKPKDPVQSQKKPSKHDKTSPSVPLGTTISKEIPTPPRTTLVEKSKPELNQTAFGNAITTPSKTASIKSTCTAVSTSSKTTSRKFESMPVISSSTCRKTTPPPPMLVNTTTIPSVTGHVHDDIKQTAKDILSRGSMPAIPPARRDWKDTTVKFNVGTTFIEWPPRNFETMTPDRKLLAWEFVASQLEYHSTGKFPDIDRIDLLDKYNFLALPGTKEQRLRDKDNTLRKCRYYNYEVLRSIVNHPDENLKPLVNQLQLTQSLRDKSTDKFLEACDRRNIQLRLGSND